MAQVICPYCSSEMSSAEVDNGTCSTCKTVTGSDWPDDEPQSAKEGESKACIIYPATLPERPTCVWLSDGMKIAIQREGGAAWLRIEKAAIIHPAATPEPGGETE